MSKSAKVGDVPNADNGAATLPCVGCGALVPDPLGDLAGHGSEEYQRKLRQAHPALCPTCEATRSERERARQEEARQREAERARQAEEARYEMRPCLDCGVPVRLLKLTPKEGCHCLGCQEKREAALQAEERARLAAEEKVRLDRIRATLPDVLGRIGVPARWQGATLDRCGDLPAELVAQARTWEEWGGGGLVYLSGRPGCGKTFLAVSVVAARLLDGTLSEGQVRFIDERAYLNGLKAGFGTDWDGDRMSTTYQTIRALQGRAAEARDIELLILDDLGASRLTDWGRGEVAGLVEHRHAHERPTIITSNLSLDELATAIDPRVASRLAEDGHVWQFPDRDLRLDGGIARRGR